MARTGWGGETSGERWPREGRGGRGGRGGGGRGGRGEVRRGSADGRDLVRGRAHGAEDAVEPEQRPVHLDVDPARRRVDVLPRVVRAPACAQGTQAHLRIRVHSEHISQSPIYYVRRVRKYYSSG